MAASATVRAVLGELRDSLAEDGFVADGTRLFARSDRGDYVLVQVEKAVGVYGDRLEHVLVDLAAVPGPWWDWVWTGSAELRKRGVAHPSWHHGMWKLRMHSVGGVHDDGTWAPGDASKQAATVLGREIARRLRSEWLPLLLSLLDRDTLMAQFATRGPAVIRTYRTALLADAGPSPELEQLLAEFDTNAANEQRFVQWARDYAAGQPPRGRLLRSR